MADFHELYNAMMRSQEPASYVVQQAELLGRYLEYLPAAGGWSWLAPFAFEATPISLERAEALALEFGGRVIADPYRREPIDPDDAEYRRLCDRADYGFIGRGDQ